MSKPSDSESAPKHLKGSRSRKLAFYLRRRRPRPPAASSSAPQKIEAAPVEVKPRPAKPAPDKSNKKLQAQIEQLEIQKQSAEDSVERLESDKRSLHKRIEAAESEKSSFEEKAKAADEKIAALEKEAADLRETLLRLRAEFENFRKRQVRDREEQINLGLQGFAKSLIPVMDNLDRALEAAKVANDLPSFTKGVGMIARSFHESLAAQGVERVEAAGKPFDPRFHEAMATEENTQLPDHSVVAELQPGYLFRGKLLRPAMVKVSIDPAHATRPRKGAPTPPPPEVAEEIAEEPPPSGDGQDNPGDP